MEKTETERTLESVTAARIPTGWEDLFKDRWEDICNISYILEERLADHTKTVLPDFDDTFNAYHAVRPENVKVVIIGQDPYPAILSSGYPEAVGLSFSGQPDERIPDSLKRIFQKLKQEYSGASYTFSAKNIDMPKAKKKTKKEIEAEATPEYREKLAKREELKADEIMKSFEMPENGDLRGWCKQGVMLLNMALTVSPVRTSSGTKPKTDGGMWKGFILETLLYLNKYNPNLIFIAWGGEAKKFITAHDTKAVKGIRILGGHPSKLNRNDDFFPNDYFRPTNWLLIDMDKEPIDWNCTSLARWESIQ